MALTNNRSTITELRPNAIAALAVIVVLMIGAVVVKAFLS
jgi:hypothetical protein